MNTAFVPRRVVPASSIKIRAYNKCEHPPADDPMSADDPGDGPVPELPAADCPERERESPEPAPKRVKLRRGPAKTDASGRRLEQLGVTRGPIQLDPDDVSALVGDRSPFLATLPPLQECASADDHDDLSARTFAALASGDPLPRTCLEPAMEAGLLPLDEGVSEAWEPSACDAASGVGRFERVVLSRKKAAPAPRSPAARAPSTQTSAATGLKPCKVEGCSLLRRAHDQAYCKCAVRLAPVCLHLPCRVVSR